MCGEKTGNDIISLNQNAIYENCSSMEGNKLKSILHHAIDEGKWIGVRLKGEWLFNWGEKTGNDIIGLNQNAIYENCSSMEGNKLKSILHHAIDEGNWRGVVWVGEGGRLCVARRRETTSLVSTRTPSMRISVYTCSKGVDRGRRLGVDEVCDIDLKHCSHTNETVLINFE